MARKQEQTPDPDWAGKMSHEFAKSCADFSEGVLGPLRDAVNGYKQSYVDRGWSQEAAEAMAVQYHSIMIGQFAAQNLGGPNE